ncbi:membrane protein [Moraxella bovoculi]|uniref:Probable membrane transporter protein n=1 Tax=Moraxella bovoculi TaxID=386891 RepID=A0AAC8PWK4_9GAMM|nr:TSUP family transporter [Moraxella bovoculi]AKG08194.1 membrane protein [Moraxella bovoculi]AKG09250.1 membrane protein [Moraxella bovoculi]AKG11084.1 membrane protein [Moraxella bovoculi]AKG13076.1 membrane protein [Moraxella bovoculi]
MELTTQLISILFFVALFAGFIDAMAGGGGLLTIPALLLTGMNPVAVLATNKLQACAGSFSASVTMIKKGLIHPKMMKIALLFAFVGSAVGTVLVQLSPPEFLQKALPFVIGAVGIYTLFSPNLGKLETTPKMSQKLYERTIAPLIGLYDGYFGPGTGTFFSLSQVVLRGRDLVQATARAKLLNFATNIASLIFFILGGQVVWVVGLVMMAGQLVGAYLGSHMVVKGGAKFIRPVIVVVCFCMVAKLVWG